MPATVKKLCGSLVKGNWLAAPDADALQVKWAAAPGADTDLEGFLRFAVGSGRLTEAQRAKVLQSLHKHAGDDDDPPPVKEKTGPKKPLPKPPADEFDVELVAVPRSRIKVPGQGFNIDRRDWLMLSAGGAGTLLAVGFAAGLAKLLAPKPPAPTEPEPDADKAAP